MAKSNGTLDVSALESWLWEAACTIRETLDAPKFALTSHWCHQGK